MRSFRILLLTLGLLPLLLLAGRAAQATTPPQTTIYGRPWAPATVFDQGTLPECTGFALEGLLESAPAPRSGPGGPAIYDGARAAAHYDPQDNGGLWLADGLNYLVSQHQLMTWHWAASTAEALTWLHTQGPILLEGHFSGQVNGPGYLRFDYPYPARLHAWYCFAPDPVAPDSVQCENSWGTWWGWQNGDPWWGGRFRMHAGDLTTHLAGGGHIALAVKTRPLTLVP